MPSRERVEAFVTRVLSNAHVQAIEEFYHVDATMQENFAPPRGPRSALIEAEAATLARHKGVVTQVVRPIFVEGDETVIHWIFEFTRPDASVMRIEELAHQVWRGDRILRERFYYDPSQLRR